MFFKSLRYPSFALLWIGQTASRLGDNLYQIALAWWVLDKTNSPAAMGLTLAFSFTPMIIFVLIGGAMVDRFSRKRLMLVSDFVRGILMVIIAILATNNLLQIWHIYAISFVFGFVAAFFDPAYNAVLPDLLPKEDLPSANSLTNLSRQISAIIGPALGAFLLKPLGVGGIFGLNAASFLISGLCLLFAAIPVLKISAEKNRFWLEIKQGINFVFSIPWLWITIIIFSVVNLMAAGVFRATVPALIKEVFANDANKLGTLYTISAIGSALVSIPLGSITKFRQRGILAYLATFISGLSVFLWGVSNDFTVMSVFMAIYGMGIAVFTLIWNNTVQEMVPREMLGRVYSVDLLGSYSLLPIGFGLIGWLTELTSPSLVFIICGFMTMVLTLGALFHPAIRKLD